MQVGEQESLGTTTFKNRARQLKQAEKEEQKNAEKEENEKRKSPYKNFAQLNRDELVQVRSMMKDNPNAALVFIFLIEHMDNMNALVCSYRVLQECLGLGRTTLSNSIKYLKEHNFLYVYKAGTANVYCVNPNIAWTSYGKNVQYCKFPANVIISASEQEEIDKNKKIKYTKSKILEQSQPLTATPSESKIKLEEE